MALPHPSHLYDYVSGGKTRVGILGQNNGEVKTDKHKHGTIHSLLAFTYQPSVPVPQQYHVYGVQQQLLKMAFEGTFGEAFKLTREPVKHCTAVC